MYVVIFNCVLEQLWIARCRIGMRDNVEVNPGPKRNFCKSQSFSCHWNLNSLIAQSFAKVSLLTAYLSVNKFDIVYLSETFLILKF